MRRLSAIVDAIFGSLAPVGRLVEGGGALQACGPRTAFVPRREVWAREGSSEKWLQRVSDYYFAEAQLQDVRFAAEGGAVRFTFYFDCDEPWNSEDATRNVNPEVIRCSFV